MTPLSSAPGWRSPLLAGHLPLMLHFYSKLLQGPGTPRLGTRLPQGDSAFAPLWSQGRSGHAPSRPSLWPLCGPVFSPGLPPLHVSSTKLLVTLFCGPRSQSVKLGLQLLRDRAALGRACVCANVDMLGLASGRRRPGPGGWTPDRLPETWVPGCRWGIAPDAFISPALSQACGYGGWAPRAVLRAD